MESSDLADSAGGVILHYEIKKRGLRVLFLFFNVFHKHITAS